MRFYWEFCLKCFGQFLRGTQFDVLVWCCFCGGFSSTCFFGQLSEGTQFDVLLWQVVPLSCFRDTCWRSGLCKAAGTLGAKPRHEAAAVDMSFGTFAGEMVVMSRFLRSADGQVCCCDRRQAQHGHDLETCPQVQFPASLLLCFFIIRHA